MSEYGPTGSQSGQGVPPHVPSEEIRYDLNGNPLPSQGGPPPGAYQPSPPPSPGYAPPPLSYAPPPPQQYGAPPSGPGQFGYGAPTGPGYAPPGQAAPQYGAPRAGADPSSKVGWYVAIGIAFVLVLFMIILGRATKPPMVDAPAAYKPADSPDKSFSCIGPDGWTTIGAGTEGSQEGGLLFKSGAVKIDITSSDALSFMGDAMRTPGSGTDDPNMPAPPPPVEKIHAMTKGSLSEKYDGYTEMPEQPLQVQFGDTRISEWTAKGGMFTGNLHGYRVTMLGLNKAITIDCHCPESNWETMKPVFLKVIQSIVPGSG